MTNHGGVITVERGKRGGRTCVRGLRIAVTDVLGAGFLDVFRGNKLGFS